MNQNEGSFILVEAVDPETVCCPAALLVTGLRTLGVPLHPAMPFRISHEEIEGRTRTTWQWLLASAAADGTPTGDLIKRWNDAGWIAANPASELAIVRATLHNMAFVAREIREAIPRLVLRRGDLSAHIPLNASPARREFLLGQLEGRIPLNATFVEPPVEPTPVFH